MNRLGDVIEGIFFMELSLSLNWSFNRLWDEVSGTEFE